MNEITRVLTAVSTVLFLAFTGCSSTHHSRGASLQGTWNGREPGVSPETPRTLVMSGNQFEYRGAEPNDWCKGTFTTRKDAQPKQLLLTLTDCGAPKYIGKTAIVIYKLEDGTLTATGNEPGNPAAPSSFDAPDGRRMIFKKK